MKISRTLTAHELQCVATLSFADPRTVRSFLVDPQRVRSKCAARIMRALVELGVIEPERAPMHIGKAVAKAEDADG